MVQKNNSFRSIITTTLRIEVMMIMGKFQLTAVVLVAYCLLVGDCTPVRRRRRAPFEAAGSSSEHNERVMDEEERAQLTEDFKDADRDGSGGVSMEEMQAAIERGFLDQLAVVKKTIREGFAGFDTNNDGELSLQESIDSYDDLTSRVNDALGIYNEYSEYGEYDSEFGANSEYEYDSSSQASNEDSEGSKESDESYSYEETTEAPAIETELLPEAPKIMDF